MVAKAVSFFILMSFSVQVWSEPHGPVLVSPSDCSFVDNETAAMGPVRNQAGIGLERVVGLGDSSSCFAFAAADLISHEVGHPVSAIDIAIQYFAQHSNLKLETDYPSTGGSIGPALLATIDAGGFCSEKKVRSGSFRKYGLPVSTRQALLNASHLICNSDQCGGILKDIQQVFPEIKQNPLTEKKTSVMQRLQELDGLACPKESRDGSWSAANLAARLVLNGDAKSAMNFLDQQLSEHRVAAIGYYPALIPWAYPWVKPQGLAGAHASTVVARRWNLADGGHCEYRIRDTYGPSCWGNPIANCQNGEIVVRREDLQSALLQVVAVKGKAHDSL